MNTRRLTQVVLLLLLAYEIAGPPNVLLAQTGNPMTLEQALNRARLRAPALLSARVRIDEARGRLQGASIRFQTNPVIEGTMGPRFSNQGKFTDADVSVSQDFEAFGRRSARISGAQAGVTRAIAFSQETGRQLLRDVAASFMKALAANEKLKALTAADKIAADFLSIAEKRYQAGDVPILDVNLARITSARTHAELRSGQAEQANTLGELRVLLGMPADELFMPAGDLKSLGQYDLDTLVGAAQDRPDIRVLKSELSEAESEARLGNTFKSPDVGVIGRYVRDQGDNITQAGFRITLPVFSRGQELSATGNARASRIKVELEAAKTAIRNEINSAFDAYRFRAEAAKELETSALPSLQANETLARRSYEEGEIGLTELLLIRREILEIRLSYVSTLLEAALADIDLQFKAGVLK